MQRQREEDKEPEQQPEQLKKARAAQSDEDEEEWEWDENEVSEAGRARAAQLLPMQNNDEMLALLIPGPPVPSCQLHPWSPMHLAAWRGDLPALRGLAEAAPQLLEQVAGCKKRTPLDVAVKAGQLEVARWLRRWGSRSRLVLGKLLCFAVRAKTPALLEWLLAEKVDAVPHDREQLKKLWNAALALEVGAGRTGVLHILSRAGGRAASVGLAIAALRGASDALAALEAAGGRLLKEDYAQLRGDLHSGPFNIMLQNLLGEGRPLTVLETDPATLVRHAVLACCPNLLKLLLLAGAPPEDPNALGWEQPLWLTFLGPTRVSPEDEPPKLGTDHAVKLAWLLLGAGASPHLADARGNRLLEALWCGHYWTQDQLASISPPFDLEENRERLGVMLAAAMTHWSPAPHALFPAAFRGRVRTVLCCNLRLRQNGRAWLGRDLLQLLFGWLAAAETFDHRPLQRTLEGLSQEQLRQLLANRGVHPAGDHKALVSTALQARSAAEVRRQQSQLAGAALPRVVGRLVATWEGEGGELQEHSVEVPNPTVHPWVNLGRNFIANPNGYAMLDMDLSRLPLANRISRLHATLRFNVLDARWEILIRGKHGLEFDLGAGTEQLVRSPAWVPLPPSLSFSIPFAGVRFRLESYVPLDER